MKKPLTPARIDQIKNRITDRERIKNLLANLEPHPLFQTSVGFVQLKPSDYTPHAINPNGNFTYADHPQIMAELNRTAIRLLKAELAKIEEWLAKQISRNAV